MTVAPRRAASSSRASALSLPPGYLQELRSRMPLVELIGRRVPLTRRGREYVARCPFHNEETPSFYVVEAKGFFHCFGCGAHGDQIGFLMRIDGLDFNKAVRALAQEGGTTHGTTGPQLVAARKAMLSRGVGAPATSADKVNPIIPVPADAPPCRWRHPKYGEPVTTWPYHDAEGRLVGYVARVEYVGTDGGCKKEFYPVTYCREDGTKDGWRSRGVPSPRPLYRLYQLCAAPTAPVIVAEGEKKADAVRRLFPGYLGTASMAGARSAEKSDWTPLAGRVVIIWPDHDEPGWRYAADVAELVTAIGAASVAIVTVPNEWPEKWDLADPPPDGVDNEALAELLRAATPWGGGRPQAPDDGDRKEALLARGRPSPSRLIGLARAVAIGNRGRPASALYWAACRLREGILAGEIERELGARLLVLAATRAGLSETEARGTVARGLGARAARYKGEQDL